MGEEFITYRGQQIPYLDFLNRSSEGIHSYVELLPWSKNKKEKFINAYRDIIQRGITDVSNVSGEDELGIQNSSGLDQLSEKDYEIYQNAADYIINQISGLSSNITKKEEELKPYDHYNNFLTFVKNRYYGGRSWNIGGEDDQWDYRDERNTATGLRGTEKRAALLAEYLEKYKDSIKNNKYKFEGTSFESLEDVTNRIDEAIKALKEPEWNLDDIDALDRLGLNWRTYFNNGGLDIYEYKEDGTPITFQQRYDRLQQEKEEEAKVLELKKQEELKERVGVLQYIYVPGTNAKNEKEAYEKYISDKYGTGAQAYDKINTRILELLNKETNLSNSEKIELGNFLHYIKENNPGYLNPFISNEEYDELMRHSTLDRNKKRRDFTRLPWQTSSGRDTYIDNDGNLYFVKNDRLEGRTGIIENKRLKINRDTINKYRQEFLKQHSSEGYLNTPEEEWTTADYAELTAAALDVASIIDEEPWSAAILGLLGSAGRHVALLLQPEISTSDTLYLVWDYVSSIIGAIPILGDVAIGSKTLKSIGKLSGKILQYAKYPARVGATAAVVLNTPGAVEALEKASKGESLTPEDWKTLGRLFAGVATHVKMNQTNFNAKKTLTERGVELKNPVSTTQTTGGYFSKIKGKIKDNALVHGWTTPKVKERVGSVKVKVKKSDGSVEEAEVKGIKESEVEKLEKEFKQAGNNEELKTKKLKENSEFKRAALESGVKVEDIEGVVTNRSWRNAQYNSWIKTPMFMRTTGNTFRISPKRSGVDNFEKYVEGLSWRDKLGARGMDREFKRRGYYNDTPTSTPGTSATSEPKVSKEYETPRSMVRKRSVKGYLKEINDFKATYFSGGRNKGGYRGTDHANYRSNYDQKIKSGKITGIINGKEVEFEVSSDKLKDISAEKVAELRRDFANLLQKMMLTNEDWINKALLLRQFKAKGWLRHGGRINTLEDDINDFLNKYYSL